jgi:hypothetical protein
VSYDDRAGFGGGHAGLLPSGRVFNATYLFNVRAEAQMTFAWFVDKLR